MSQSAAERDDAKPATDVEEPAVDDPDIEEDLFEEELRIDGICGVY